jgi:DNA-binding MarR family transcriptional regulator
VSNRPGDDSISVLQLMRIARNVYRNSVRQALERAGCDDIPRTAIFMLAELRHDGPESPFMAQADVVASLGSSKQAASQLIDTLVVRNYFERRNDPADRRRMELRLTSRGLTAAIAVREAVDAIDAQVAGLISPEELQGFRAGLAVYLALDEAVNPSRDSLPSPGDSSQSNKPE